MTEENVLSKFKGLYVEVRREGDPVTNLEYALKKLKRMIKRDNLLLTLNKKSHYMKPSLIRKDEKARAKTRSKSLLLEKL